MIPKIIHYCWFGGNSLPESALKCIASWKKFFPDYEIKEWNESNFNVDIIPYTKEAYEAKKYAFVSDYARFWILYNYGGVYFDTDVKVIRPMDDIIAKGPFMGREAGAYLKNICHTSGDGLAVAPGLGLGTSAGLQLYRDLLDTYATLHFKNADGSLNLKTIVCYTSEVLVKYGLGNNNSEPQLVSDVWIYPADYFCPMDHTRGCIVTITERTRSIHLYDASWSNHSSIRYKLGKIKNFLMRTFGPELVQKIIILVGIAKK